MDKKDAFLELRTKVAISDFTKRDILLMVYRDKRAFNVRFFTDFLKDIEEFKNTKHEDTTKRINNSISTFTILADEGYIKMGGLENKVTLKGKYYLLITNPATGVIIGIVAIIVAICIYIAQAQQSTSPLQIPMKKPLPEIDSIGDKQLDSSTKR